MTKQEIKKAENHTLITETIKTYAWLLQNWTMQKGTKQLEKHFQDCCEEMLERKLITKEDWDSLNQ